MDGATGETRSCGPRRGAGKSRREILCTFMGLVVPKIKMGLTYWQIGSTKAF